MGVILKRGDVFCVNGSKGWKATVIKAIQKFWSSDNSVEYTHAGIITSGKGTTLEVLWEVELSTLESYKGKQIIIARPTTLDTNIEYALGKVFPYIGLKYPLWRLIFNILPPLGKYIVTGNYLICSELTAYYLYQCGIRGRIYTGVTPDTLADEYRMWKAYDVIFEGVWE